MIPKHYILNPLRTLELVFRVQEAATVSEAQTLAWRSQKRSCSERLAWQLAKPTLDMRYAHSKSFTRHTSDLPHRGPVLFVHGVICSFVPSEAAVLPEGALQLGGILLIPSAAETVRVTVSLLMSGV